MTSARSTSSDIKRRDQNFNGDQDLVVETEDAATVFQKKKKE